MFLIKEAFLSLARIPRTVVAFAAAAVIIVAVMVAAPVVQRRAVNEYLSDQAAFIADLDEPAEANGADIFDTDIKTGAENFL